MRFWQRAGTVAGVLGSFGAVTWFTLQFGTGGLWRGLEPAIALPANAAGAKPQTPYDLTRLEAVNETLRHIRDKYVDPGRVKPRDMLLAALNRVQQDVAQVIVLHDEGSPEVTVRVETAEKRFRVDNVQGPWDVAARLREIFAFLQDHLRGTEVDLRDVEYAACNGMLRTLDPHSVFLSPEAYREMNVSTSGAFGGLGIVISIREQQLTVMSAMPGTPAGRAGLKRGDKITKINTESTLNMPIDDAVRRLRGEPGTKVTVWVHREGDGGWPGSKPFELSRENIKVASVEKQGLDGGVGYVRLKQFQSGTAAELEAALGELRKKEGGQLKGLVLDLRGNPGGLLDQAVKVADLFLKEGTIVSTVGAADAPDEKRARAAGTEPDYPLVVLVNGSSASASEIVAGALKNLDRAVIVGTTSFGKGSVQLIFSDITPDKAALKLTIAQYLTPGNVSIQSVGIVPDVELDPMTVDPLEIDLYSAPKVLRERDLSSHLSNTKAREGQKAPYSVRYYMPEGERAQLRSRGGDPEDGKFEADFQVRFARELALRMAPGQRRGEQLRALGEYMAQVQRDEVAKAAADLAKLGVDWAEAPSADAGPQARDFEVSASTDRPGDEVTAGEPMALRVTVKNNGKDPVYRLRAATVSDNGYYDGKELVFGKIAPGQSKTATIPLGVCEPDDKKKPEGKDPVKNPEAVPRVCRVPKDSVTRQDGIKVRFESTGDHAPADVEVRPTVHALERPLFAYAYEVVDNRGGANGDGRLQKGEGATLYLAVKNVGKGRSYETQANLANLSGEGVLLNEGRFDISNMQPGETRRLELTFDALPSLQESEVKLRLSVGDLDLHEMASEKVRVAVEPPVKPQPASGAVRARAQGATLLESPSSGGRAFGRLKPGSALAVKGQVGEFLKVDLGKNRFAFVAAGEVEPGGTPSAEGHPFEDLLSRSPPNVELKAAQLATRDGKVKLVGTASDNDRVLDAYMFVNSRKVFYRSNRNAADPKSLSFEQEINLRPGVNVIRFFARENSDTVTARTLVVRRDGAGGELLPTPKADESILDEGPGDEPLAPPRGPRLRAAAPRARAPRGPRRARPPRRRPAPAAPPETHAVVDFGSDLRNRTLVLCAALAFAIAASVLLRGRRRPNHRLFAAFAGDVAVWYLAQSLYGFLQANIWARVTAVLAALLPHLAIRLFEAIVPPPPGSPRRLRRAALLLSLPVGLVVASPYYGHGYARGLVFFYAFGLLAAALWALAARGQRSPSRAIKGRVRYLVVVGALATAFNLFDFLWFIGAELPPFGSVLSVIFLFALAESLERERLLDLYELLGRLFVSTALAFSLAGIFYLCVTVIGRFNTMYLNAVLGAVVILVLFEPLRAKVEEQIHQIFFRERFDLERAVAGAKRALAHALEVDEMCRAVLRELESSRRATGAALYLRDSEGRGFERAGFFGPPPPERLELAAAAALCELVARRGSVRLEEASAGEGTLRPGEGYDVGLLRAAAELLGPLREGAVIGSRDEAGELLALLVVADDRVRDAFSPEEVSLLEALGAQISVVLENTHVYARLKTRDRLAALGQMAAGLAHEIKNPLGAIKGAAQLLVDPSPAAPAIDPNAREFVGIILEEVERLDRVVRSVLDYARPSAAHDAASDVNAVARRTAQILAPADGDDYRIELALGEGLPPACIDAEKLRQVLINLVQNAVQAMGGRGTVRVASRLRPTRPAWASRAAPEAGAWVEVVVSDEGPGISKHVLKNLFVPFFTTKDRGTGLGLAISQHIAQAAGGHIEVSTLEGSGTTFSVLLPAEAPPAAPLRDRASAPGPAEAGASAGGAP